MYLNYFRRINEKPSFSGWGMTLLTTSMPWENTKMESALLFKKINDNLMKAIQLTIKVPGNTALCAGDIVKLIIPSSKESGEKVERDRKFSGKYLIAAHTFFYSKKGCTSELLLIRDSIPKKG